MGNTSKTYAILLTIIFLMSCLTILIVKPADAQTITKPSAPELTVAFANHSYDVPPTTTATTNAYTGEKIVTTKDGYHIQNDSFVLSLRGKPISENIIVDGSGVRLFFIVQSKGRYSDNWGNLTYVGDSSLQLVYTNDGYAQKVMQLAGNNGTSYTGEGGYNDYEYDGFVDAQYGGQVQFRAMSVIGYIVTVQDEINPFNVRHPYHEVFVALQSSDWSSIQTIDVPANTSTNFFASIDSQLLNQPWTNFALIVAVAVLSIAVIALSVYVRRIRNQLPKQ